MSAEPSVRPMLSLPQMIAVDQECGLVHTRLLPQMMALSQATLSLPQIIAVPQAASFT